jgi:hypothetical protein
MHRSNVGQYFGSLEMHSANIFPRSVLALRCPLCPNSGRESGFAQTVPL